MFEMPRATEGQAEQTLDEVESRRTAKRQKQKRSRDEKFPAHLPRYEKIVDLPEDQKVGKTLLGYDEVETLEFERAKLRVRVTLIVPPTLPELDPRDPRTPRIIEVLSKAQAKGRPSVKARMWAYRSLELPFNVFDFTVSRGHRPAALVGDGPDEMLSDFTSSLLGDCWSGFQKIELRSNSRIQRAACWAHARRKLDECRENYPRHTTVLLALIRQLYDLEDRAKLWSAEQRLELRRREAVRVLKQIRAYLDGPQLERLLPKSDLTEAIGYLKNNWDALLLYTTDGRLPIDNNETEHLMKQIRAPTRSSWSGQEELVAHWQLGGGSSRGELNDNHQHGRPQRSGRV